MHLVSGHVCLIGSFQDAKTGPTHNVLKSWFSLPVVYCYKAELKQQLCSNNLENRKREILPRGHQNLTAGWWRAGALRMMGISVSQGRCISPLQEHTQPRAALRRWHWPHSYNGKLEPFFPNASQVLWPGSVRAPGGETLCFKKEKSRLNAPFKLWQ